jgi:hypothetical protein
MILFGLTLSIPFLYRWPGGSPLPLRPRSSSNRGQFTGTAQPELVAPEEIARRAEQVDELRRLIPPGMSPVHGALQFVLVHPAGSTVILGAGRSLRCATTCRRPRAGSTRTP